nr:epsin-1 isoform X1 [Nothobranchius furzeri]XP_054601304.1 epsin-1 isoform X1 [Nothobranchius furzeri]
MTSSMLRRQLKNLVQNYSEAEVKVREATSNDPWGPSSSQMADISDLTYNAIACSEIMTMLWKRLKDDKNWRHIHKSLTLLEYLLKTGDDRVLLKMKENIYIVKALTEYRFVEKDGKDQGVNVREKAKVVLVLMEDDEKLKAEREFAFKTREKTSKGAAASSADNVKDPGYKPVYVPGATGLPSLDNIPSVADLTASFAARKEERLRQEAEKKEVDRRAKLSEDELAWEDAGKSNDAKSDAWGGEKEEEKEEVKKDPWGAPKKPSSDPWGAPAKTEEDQIETGETDEDHFAAPKDKPDPFSSSNGDPFNAPKDDPFGAPKDDPFNAPKDDPFSAPKDDPFNAPKDDPFNAPKDDPFNTPKDDPFNAPKDDPFNAPKDDPFNAPKDDPFGAPKDDPFNAPKDDPFNAPKDDPFNAPKDDPFNAPKDDPFNAPKDDPFSAPKDDPFNAPKDDPFGAPKDDPFGAPKDDPFNAPKDDPFNAPKDDPFNAPKDDPFNAPKDDPFGAPKDDPFGAPKDDPFGAPKDDPFGAPKNDPFITQTDDPFIAPVSTTPKEEPFPEPSLSKGGSFTSPTTPPNDAFTSPTQPVQNDPFAAPPTPPKEDPFATSPKSTKDDPFAAPVSSQEDSFSTASKPTKDDPFAVPSSPPKEDPFTVQSSPPEDPFHAPPVSSPQDKADEWGASTTSQTTGPDAWGDAPKGGDPWGDGTSASSRDDNCNPFGDSSKPDNDPWGAPASAPASTDDAWGTPASPLDSSGDPFGDGSKNNDPWGALSSASAGKRTAKEEETCKKTGLFLGSAGAALVDLDHLFAPDPKPKRHSHSNTLAAQTPAIGPLKAKGMASAPLDRSGAFADPLAQNHDPFSPSLTPAHGAIPPIFGAAETAQLKEPLWAVGAPLSAPCVFRAAQVAPETGKVPPTFVIGNPQREMGMMPLGYPAEDPLGTADVSSSSDSAGLNPFIGYSPHTKEEGFLDESITIGDNPFLL